MGISHSRHNIGELQWDNLMKTLNLYRLESTDQGTFGIITHSGRWWYTLELPNRDNKPNISCIPTGEYDVSLRFSPHFKRNLYHVKKVPKRSFILIHGANFAGDKSKGFQTHLQGCITLGKKIGKSKNKYGIMQQCVFSSQQAIMEFTDYLDNEPFKITIKDL